MPIIGTLVPVAGSILDPLYIAFGWVMRHLYAFFNDYGVVVIVFTVLVRALLIPLGVKQHKTTLKMQALAPQVDDLKRVYGKDKQGLQQATMELYKQNNVSQLGGCLPSLLIIFIIWPIYRMVSAPLHYIAGATEAGVASTAQYLQSMGHLAEAQVKQIHTMDIPVVQALQEHSNAFAHSVQQGWLQAKDLIDLHFFGIDLGLVPTLSPSKLFGAEAGTWLPLMIIVLLAVVTTFLMSKVTEWTNPNYHKMKEDKARAKNNPARTEPTDMTNQGMMKGMKYTMPAFTLFISMTMPTAMALYWIVGNLMAIVQQYILYFLYTRNHLASSEVAQKIKE